MEYPLFLVMILIICKISEAIMCSKDGTKVCCSGYKLNKGSGLCDRCPPGYTGHECIYSCLFPFYGVDCFMKCACSNDTCDFVSGCKLTTTTVNPRTSYKTTRLRKPHTPTTDAVTQNQSLKKSTESGSPSIGLFSIPTVVNITIVLISVFVISFLIYGLSYLRKVFTSRQNNKLNFQYSANNNGVYECVEFPHHM